MILNEIILIIQMGPMLLQKSLQAKEQGRSFIVTENVMTEAEVTVVQFLALKTDSGARNQRMQPISKSWKRQAKIVLPIASRGFQPCRHFDISRVRCIWTYELLNKKIIKSFFCCFRSVASGNLLQQQQETNTGSQSKLALDRD